MESSQVINILRKVQEASAWCQFFGHCTFAKTATRRKKSSVSIIQRIVDAVIFLHMKAHTIVACDLRHPALSVAWESGTPADATVPVQVKDDFVLSGRKSLWLWQYGKVAFIGYPCASTKKLLTQNRITNFTKRSKNNDFSM